MVAPKKASSKSPQKTPSKASKTNRDEDPDYLDLSTIGSDDDDRQKSAQKLVIKRYLFVVFPVFKLFTAAQKRSSTSKSKFLGRRAWTDKETLYLVVGVELYGRSWSRILGKYESKFNNRTSVDLKDRHRNLIRNGMLGRFEKEAKLLIAKQSADKD